MTLLQVACTQWKRIIMFLINKYPKTVYKKPQDIPPTVAHYNNGIKSLNQFKVCMMNEN